MTEISLTAILCQNFMTVRCNITGKVIALKVIYLGNRNYNRS